MCVSIMLYTHDKFDFIIIICMQGESTATCCTFGKFMCYNLVIRYNYVIVRTR